MMRDTIPADELLSKAHAIGQYYGFTPLSTITAISRGAARKAVEYPEFLSQLGNDSAAETVSSFLKQFQRIEQIPTLRQPMFVWHTNIAPGRPAPKKAVIQLHALGADHALADAVIIRAVNALVRDLFHEEPVVRVNSMGDKETRARYTRELGNFFKKRASTLPEECVTCAKQDTMLAAELAIARECAEDLPSPTEHLSDASRKRFEDLLEYLEMTETPYELARTLISRGNVWNDTCFEIMAGGRRVAWGSHYGDFTRHFFPTPFSASGAVIQIGSSGTVVKKALPTKMRFSFVHIGDEAKRLSIRLAEDFRKARISLTQNIGVESLTEQLYLAERRESPYLLIMGRKEALEGSAILRNRQTQEETIVPLAGIIDHLKSVA
ncbi:MAG: His/Gly/Thr/Pro-type tRNA ligase C-terminal domain-containing protein [bacterium]|nr:His/Gly/Thr/Pro-type tRNA ligase C-terminal domain-containing protein [bacterium]MDO8742535.1 His/Gly/Thr/Pro-type tRNA ligase C-terminal domain-containing protein [bacterium]